MEINQLIDHTQLKAFATKKEIETLCEEAKQYHFKSVCVNPCQVKYASELLKDSGVLVCTVIGFPLGANTTEIKVLEAMDAIRNGAEELDIVMNIGLAKNHEWDEVEKELHSFVIACGDKTSKVIIETCYLTEDEIVEACKRVKASGATFVKTSTGFGPKGATVENVRIMRQTVGPEMGVKAAGGIHTLEDVKAMVEAGATRIGASAGVKIMMELSTKETN
jgi:deoxyribose-phosphate aldolase